MLTVGRTPDGIWYDRVRIADHQSPDTRVADNWGYLLNAYATFDAAEGTDIYRKEIERGMTAAASRRSFPWEFDHHDGYADSLESMIYQFRRYDQPGAKSWTDDEMEVMFDMQTSGGIVSATYLDGNFVRTALLYADWKRQGVSADPWTTAVTVGASWDSAKKELVLCVDAPAGWDGALRFDGPRHRTTWNFPTDYPRLNSWPEWFVADAEKSYIVTSLDDDTSRTVTGAEMQKGIKAPPPTDEPSYLTIRAAQ